MELHHKNHHQTYVNSFNDASSKLSEALSKSDPASIQSAIKLQSLVNFHGGGHVNHTLFWESLAPKSAGGGEPPSGALAKVIDESFGGLEQLKGEMNKTLAGIQGSGWAWLVRDDITGGIMVKPYAVGDLMWQVVAESGMKANLGVEPRSGCRIVHAVVGYRRVGTCVLVSLCGL